MTITFFRYRKCTLFCVKDWLIAIGENRTAANYDDVLNVLDYGIYRCKKWLENGRLEHLKKKSLQKLNISNVSQFFVYCTI